MKSAKELASLAFKFAENMINMKRKSIESGNLSESEAQEAQEAIDQFESIKKDFEDKEFSSELNVAERIFMTMRNLIASGNDIPIEFSEKLKDLHSEDIADAVINHVSKLNGEEFDEDLEVKYKELMNSASDKGIQPEDVTPENAAEWLNQFMEVNEVVNFASDGKDCINSAIKFLEQIVKRMENAETPKVAQIAEYKKAIDGLNSYMANETKQFTAAKFIKKFAEGAASVPEFSKVLDELTEEGVDITINESHSDGDKTEEVYEFSYDDYTLILIVTKDNSGVTIIDEDLDDNVLVELSDLKKYIENQLFDIVVD